MAINSLTYNSGFSVKFFFQPIYANYIIGINGPIYKLGT